MSTEIHHDLPRQAHERRISPDHLQSISTSLANITNLPSSRLLLPEDLPYAETIFAESAQNDEEEPVNRDIIGRQWVTSDEGSEIRIAQYYPEFQKELSRFDYRSQSEKLKVHGHLAFRKELGRNSFSGIILFLGDGDALEEIDVKIERVVDPADPNVGFVITQFAGMVGLTTVNSALTSGNARQWTGEITATYLQGKDIAESLSGLYHDASGV